MARACVRDDAHSHALNDQRYVYRALLSIGQSLIKIPSACHSFIQLIRSTEFDITHALFRAHQLSLDQQHFYFTFPIFRFMFCYFTFFCLLLLPGWTATNEGIFGAFFRLSFAISKTCSSICDAVESEKEATRKNSSKRYRDKEKWDKKNVLKPYAYMKIFDEREAGREGEKKDPLKNIVFNQKCKMCQWILNDFVKFLYPFYGSKHSIYCVRSYFSKNSC